MSNYGYLSSKDNLAVENLLSQAIDLYVLEQVAAINCSGFTDSVLPTNLETRFRQLKSLPVSRQPDPVSSSKKLLSHSSSMASYPEKNHGNAFSASAFSGDEKRNLSRRIKRAPTVKSRPLVSSVKETRGIKRDPSVNSRGGEDFSGSGKIGSVSSRFSRDSGKTGSSSSRFPRDGGKVFAPPTTQPVIDLVSPSSDTDLNQEELSNRKSKLKSKSKWSVSWFDKLSPSRAMSCLCSSSAVNSPPELVRIEAVAKKN